MVYDRRVSLRIDDRKDLHSENNNTLDGGYQENAVNVEDYHLDGEHSINGVDNGDPQGVGDTDSNAIWRYYWCQCIVCKPGEHDLLQTGRLPALGPGALPPSQGAQPCKIFICHDLLI